jgi:hypothetical protein
VEIVPVTFATASAFVAEHHRHNKPPRGWKFGVGVAGADGELVGVALAGRPVARALDDGRTIEVNRTCTTGEPNANSMLYGAVWRAAKALGYLRAYTYTQHTESGASLRAAGWVRDADLPARGSWADHSVQLRDTRDPSGPGGVARVRWRIASDRTIKPNYGAPIEGLPGAFTGPPPWDPEVGASAPDANRSRGEYVVGDV